MQYDLSKMAYDAALDYVNNILGNNMKQRLGLDSLIDLMVTHRFDDEYDRQIDIDCELWEAFTRDFP